MLPSQTKLMSLAVQPCSLVLVHWPQAWICQKPERIQKKNTQSASLGVTRPLLSPCFISMAVLTPFHFNLSPQFSPRFRSALIEIQESCSYLPICLSLISVSPDTGFLSAPSPRPSLQLTCLVHVLMRPNSCEGQSLGASNVIRSCHQEASNC